MSFASGLFSFLGGASQQFREEIDLANVRKANEAAAAAERQEKLRAFQEEQRKHNEMMALNRDKFALDQEVQAFNEKKFQLEHGIDIRKIDLEEQKWHSGFEQSLKEYELKVKRLESDIANAATVEKRKELEFQLEQEKLDYQKENDALRLKFGYDEVQWNNETKLLIEKLKIQNEIEKSKKGTVGFGVGLEFNFKDFSSLDERVAGFVSYMDTNLTEEKIDAMTEAEKNTLKGYMSSYADLAYKAVLTKDGIQGDPSKTLAMDNYFDMLDYLGESPTQSLVDNAKKENPNADNFSVTSDGSSISVNPLDYKALSSEAGFETVENFKSAMNSLIKVASKESSVGAARLDKNLSPFKSEAALIESMRTKKIPLGFLKVVDDLNRLQELRYDDIPGFDFTPMIQKLFDSGELTLDKQYNRVLNEEKLVDFIYMLQPLKEFGDGSASSSNPKAFNQEERFDLKALSAQNASAIQARDTVSALFNVVNDPDNGDIIGASLNIAALAYGGIKQVDSLKSLFGGSTYKFSGDGLNIVDSITGERDEKKIKEIQDEIEGAVEALSSTEELAAKKAKITLLKFTLAYQVSMALQGGSGGRTISDQDVDNILRGLDLDDKFFSLTTQTKTLTALATLDEFLEGIQLRTKYVGRFNSMRAHRTYDATTKILQLINGRGGAGFTSQSFLEQMQERANVGLEQNDDIAKSYNSNEYKKSWDIVPSSNNGTPLYVEKKKSGFGFDATTARYIPVELYEKMINDLEISDGEIMEVQPYSDALQYKGLAIKNILGQN